MSKAAALAGVFTWEPGGVLQGLGARGGGLNLAWPALQRGARRGTSRAAAGRAGCFPARAREQPRRSRGTAWGMNPVFQVEVKGGDAVRVAKIPLLGLGWEARRGGRE